MCNTDPIPPRTPVSFTDCNGHRRNGMIISWMRPHTGKERVALIAYGITAPSMLETIPFSRINKLPAEPACQLIAAELCLASLLGWTNLKIIADSMIGTPPEGIYSVRNEKMAPRWARDWAVCGALMVEHEIEVEFNGDYVSAHYLEMSANSILGGRLKHIGINYADHPTKDSATLFAVIEAVIAKLKASAV